MKLLREPLLHFLLLGAALFVVFELIATDDAQPDRIVVSAGRIEHLATGFSRTWQRPPTDRELLGLKRVAKGKPLATALRGLVAEMLQRRGAR